MKMIELKLGNDEIKYVNPQHILSIFKNQHNKFVVETIKEKYYSNEINSVILNFYGTTISTL
jgi:hypothetical protein